MEFDDCLRSRSFQVCQGRVGGIGLDLVAVHVFVEGEPVGPEPAGVGPKPPVLEVRRVERRPPDAVVAATAAIVFSETGMSHRRDRGIKAVLPTQTDCCDSFPPCCRSSPAIALDTPRLSTP